MNVRGSLARRLATDPDEHPHRRVLTAAERRTLIRNTTLVSGIGLGVLGAVTGAAGGALIGALAGMDHDYQRTHHIPDRPPAR